MFQIDEANDESLSEILVTGLELRGNLDMIRDCTSEGIYSSPEPSDSRSRLCFPSLSIWLRWKSIDNQIPWPRFSRASVVVSPLLKKKSIAHDVPSNVLDRSA